MYYSYMKNLHLEHPEDAILNDSRSGARNVLRFLRERNSELSVKYDGAPAVVWGTCPATGKFFVGTKSVFNKKKIKINYSHFDISQNHEGNVASILHVCFDNLPRVKGIVQGDFIGFGGNDFYKPNTIEYIFSSVVQENCVVAAHTSYTSDTTLKDAAASFGVNEDLESDKVKFLNTHAQFTSRRRRIDLLLALASMAINFVKFPSEKEGKELKVVINRYIREGMPLDPIALSGETGFHKNLFHLYNLIIEIKELLMEGITSDEDVVCYIGDGMCDHEGYVMTNKFGTFKLINRRQFSYANFTLKKSWS